MAGMIGMAQTLAVYHYGYHTLKNRLVQYHEPAREPSDAEAVLEWGLDTPFTSQDKPPLAIAMVVTLNGVRSLRRYRLVIAQKSKLRLTQEVTAALASHSRDHRLTASGLFPCSIDREYLYGYAGDGYRSPLWLCVSHNGSPVLVHRLRGNKIHFHQATKDRRILLIPGIHYFDAHRLQPLLLQAPALQIHLRASPLAGPERAGETVEDPSSDEERATTDGESEVEAEAEEADLPPEEPWCPPIPDAPDDPTEMEIAGAADKLATMMNSSQPQANVFFQPDNLGALPYLWLQAKLTISLTSIQDKFARLFMSIAAELWLRDAIDTVEEVFNARSPQLHAPASRKACAVHLLADSTSGVPGDPRDWMPSVCHVLVSSNSLRANRGSHRECRREPRTCPQWPRESCGHQSAPLSAPQWCRSCQRSLGPPGVVSCKLGQQDCTVLHRGRRWLHTTPARSCHCLSSSRVRRTAKGCGWPSAAGSQVHRQECPWTEPGAGWGIPSSQLFYGTHPWVHNGRSGTLHHDGSATHWTHKSQLGSHRTIPNRTYSSKVEADSYSVPTRLAVKL